LRKFLIGTVVAAAAALVAYLLDPDRGRSRRARLSDQMAARARDVADTAKAKVEYQKGVMKGVAHDITEPFRGKNGEFDDQTILQKIRSEALGRLDSKSGIEIDVRDGRVTVSGSLEGVEDRARILDLIRRVDGVTEVEDRFETM
jgi:osmotically-inducible protein OsmY